MTTCSRSRRRRRLSTNSRECSHSCFRSTQKDFLEKTEDLLTFLLPNYVDEGKTDLVIAVGCTGGHHRSVSVARCIASYLTALGYPAFENHRDITRG